MFTKALEHLGGKRQPEPEPAQDNEAAAGEPGHEHPANLLAGPGEVRCFEQACADALVELCSSYLHTSAEAVRATVVIHAELILEGPDHEPVGIGRRSRQVPGWLWRVLWHRDQGCRFPGCERQRWIQNHHLHHWTKNGPTDKRNLVLLCWYHHQLVHEGGRQLWGVPDEWLDFISPAGHILISLPPPPLDPDLRRRLFDAFSGDPPQSDTG